MKTRIVIVSCAVLGMLLTSACDPLPDSIPAYEFEQYVLYSWNVRSSEFCFALMIQADRYQFRRHWFPKRNAKCGVAELRTAIMALPKGSFVLWQDSPSKGFDYPDDNVVLEAIEFAKGHGIKLVRSPALE